uniref:Right handed beta helix domain-containing protein n=1 Tax=Amphimedon queenslandica TaxID=400682 RepID=A0A1X7UGM8_AMPQE
MTGSLFLVCLVVQSVSSLYISIDGDKGNDSIDCLQGQHSCQSLIYVSHSTITSNLTIEINSSTLAIKGSVSFTGFNGLTINGQRSNIKCSGNESNQNGSGIVFNNCINVNLNNFAIKYCGLVYQQDQYYGLQAVLFYNCSGIFLSLLKFANSNGTGLVLYNNTGGSGNVSMSGCTFSNNSYLEKETVDQVRFTGGGLRIIQVWEVAINIYVCKFVKNSAASVGGALFVTFQDLFVTNITVTGSSFINNIAGTRGGAIAVTVHRNDYHVYLKVHRYSINFQACNIIGNIAQFGGGVALQIPHSDIYDVSSLTSRSNKIRFHFCKFIGNKGKVTSAVDINGSSQKLYQSIYTSVEFQIDNQFINNTAGIDLQGPHPQYKGKLFKATIFAIDVEVILTHRLNFYNNTGTPIYFLNSRLHITGKSDPNNGSAKTSITFVNNTGDHGGAIFIDNTAMDLYFNGTLHFSGNTAVIGGAIFIQSLNIMQYEGTCFLQNDVTALQLHFSNNSATSGIGHDIFASTLQPCVQLYKSNTTALFVDGKMGKFNFSSSVSQSVSTAPARLLLNKTHLFPFPGLPYTIDVMQLDELNQSVINLQLFPLSATWLHNTPIKMNLTHSIGRDYVIIFNGQIGDNGTLLLQTTEYSAALYINVTLFQCPPGYIFQADTCHCSHSISDLYYYGIPHCLENRSAVISTGTWAGYLKEKFTTADCVEWCIVW